MQIQQAKPRPSSGSLTPRKMMSSLGKKMGLIPHKSKIPADSGMKGVNGEVRM